MLRWSADVTVFSHQFIYSPRQSALIVIILTTSLLLRQSGIVLCWTLALTVFDEKVVRKKYMCYALPYPGTGFDSGLVEDLFELGLVSTGTGVRLHRSTCHTTLSMTMSIRNTKEITSWDSIFPLMGIQGHRRRSILSEDLWGLVLRHATVFRKFKRSSFMAVWEWTPAIWTWRKIHRFEEVQNKPANLEVLESWICE